MSPWRIALDPGNGIGPEVLDQALRVPDRVQRVEGTFTLDDTRFPWSAGSLVREGRPAGDCEFRAPLSDGARPARISFFLGKEARRAGMIHAEPSREQQS